MNDVLGYALVWCGGLGVGWWIAIAVGQRQKPVEPKPEPEIDLLDAPEAGDVVTWLEGEDIRFRGTFEGYLASPMGTIDADLEYFIVKLPEGHRVKVHVEDVIDIRKPGPDRS